MNWRLRGAVFVDQVNKIVSWVCFALLIAITIATSLQVFLRFVLNQPTSWSEEVSLLFLIWFGLLAIAIGIRRHEHISITVLRDALPGPLAKALDYGAQILMALFMLALVVYGQELLALAGKQLLPASRISKSWLYLPTIVGGALGLFNAVSNIVLASPGSGSAHSLDDNRAY